MNQIIPETFLAQLADSPNRLSWLENAVQEEGVGFVHRLAEAADESAYSLRQWVDACMVIGRWLELRELRACYMAQLGYVHCACEAASATSNLVALPDLIGEMLADYGFAAAEKK